MSRFRRHQQGFSLLEIMIVVLIIAIGAATIRLAVVTPDPYKELTEEADNFRVWFQNQQFEALLSGIELGLYLTEEELQLLTFDEVEQLWEVSNSRPLVTDLDAINYDLTLNLESPNWLDLSIPWDEDDPEAIPHIIIYPSEEYEPSFLISLYYRDEPSTKLLLEGNGFNEISVVKPDA